MYIYITNGTYEYLKGIEEKYPDETMVTVENDTDALLLHETAGESIFKTPRKYEIIDSKGSFKKSGFVAMYHIPVTEEGRSIFEYHFKNRTRQVENAPGFLAIRVLRPLTSNTYIIITMWENETAFKDWIHSSSFLNPYPENEETNGEDLQKKIFSSAAYVKEYIIPEEDE